MSTKMKELLPEDVHYAKSDIIVSLKKVIEACERYDTNDLSHGEKSKYDNMIRALHTMVSFVQSLNV
jgi:hypothetical protein